MVREVELCRRFATWCKCWRKEAACWLVGRGGRSFWGLGTTRGGCTPKAVPADAEVVLRIGNNDADWLIK